jgi:hypothetical protein
MIQIFKRDAAFAKDKPVDCFVGTVFLPLDSLTLHWQGFACKQKFD